MILQGKNSIAQAELPGIEWQLPDYIIISVYRPWF